MEGICGPTGRGQPTVSICPMRREPLSLGWLGLRANNMVLEACPVPFSLHGLVVFTVFRCDVRGLSTDFLTLTNGSKHSSRKKTQLSLFFDNNLRADEGSWLQSAGSIAEIVRVKISSSVSQECTHYGWKKCLRPQMDMGCPEAWGVVTPAFMGAGRGEQE